MSWKQRRNHLPKPGVPRKGITLCETCGDRLRVVREVVTDTSKPLSEQRRERTHWRHWRKGDNR